MCGHLEFKWGRLNCLETDTKKQKHTNIYYFYIVIKDTTPNLKQLRTFINKN